MIKELLQDTLVAVEHFFPTLAVAHKGKVNHLSKKKWQYIFLKDGGVTQDFSGMVELNRFQMRKTFWEQVANCAGFLGL